MKHLCVVFQTIQRSGSRLTLKCNFARRRVKFLGHVVGSGQHSPDPGKVESIKNISVPTTKKEIRSFLGLTSYYREYIPNFASLVLPLTELTRNRVPNIIPWNEVAEQAFTKLKAQLVKAPSLYTPDLSKPYQLYTDASATAIGACLSQKTMKRVKRTQLHFHLYAEIVEVEIEVVSPSIVPSGNFAELNRTVTCMVFKANDRRTSCPRHDEFRGPRSDYVRQVASENKSMFFSGSHHVSLHF
ncbi:retrovirus-related Pol polyprotein from transposon 297 [Trichonephila clavipes]|nr:retrovirus-related Pol polyprotein from transposon 297 [Trichonephila clavipes]